MRIRSTLSVLLLAALCTAGGIASAQQGPKPAPKAAAKENVTTPGPTGGSCSATSDDGKKTCSISCGSGKEAVCTNTATNATCRCSL